MIQITNPNTLNPETMHKTQEDTYTYNDSEVKIITIFTDNGTSTALVEDENGNVFEVLRDSLR